MLRSFLFVLLAGAIGRSVVVDRIAVVVGKHAIKLSDIDRDLRVTEFQNREPLNLSPAERKKAAERLVDQAIISDEIVNGQYQRPSQAEADALLAKIRQERFGGSDQRMRQALTTYGLTQDTLRAQLYWQLEVLKFIDQRFHPGVYVTDEEVRDYYNQHKAELTRQNPRTPGLEALDSKIRSTIEGERMNQSFDEWLDRARKRNRVEYHQEAFQ